MNYSWSSFAEKLMFLLISGIGYRLRGSRTVSGSWNSHFECHAYFLQNDSDGLHSFSVDLPSCFGINTPIVSSSAPVSPQKQLYQQTESKDEIPGKILSPTLQLDRASWTMLITFCCIVWLIQFDWIELDCFGCSYRCGYGRRDQSGWGDRSAGGCQRLLRLRTP